VKPELHRAVHTLHLLGRKYPRAWDIHNEFRSSCTNDANWPEYVFAPRQAARHVVTGGTPVTKDDAGAITFVGALAAWRPTQGIYRFDDSLLDALWATPVTGNLPGDLLHRLPEWCVYIELGRATALGFVHGVWARIGFDSDTREEELDLLAEVNDGCVSVRLPLVGTLEDSLEVSRRDALGLAGGDPVRRLEAEIHHANRRTMAEPILSVVLYLCSANAEMRSTAQIDRPRRPKPQRHKSGDLRWHAADEPVIWQTGTRLGAALRRAHERLTDAAGDGTGATVRPHIRRAHWHAFWVGALNSPERRQDVRWLPPIPVNLEDEVPEVATIRPVPEPK
jgi:hypothetical protein